MIPQMQTGTVVTYTEQDSKDALKVLTDIAAMAKQVKKRDVTKKQRAFDIISTMRDAGQSETEVLKALQSELGLTYPNAYYYTKRVFTK